MGAFSAAGCGRDMVRDPHSWTAARRAPPALCTHSGSRKGPTTGDRHWEVMWGGTHAVGLSTWSALGEGRMLGKVLWVSGRGWQQRAPMPSGHLQIHLPLLSSSASPTCCSCGIQVRTHRPVCRRQPPCDSTSTTLDSSTQAQTITSG